MQNKYPVPIPPESLRFMDSTEEKFMIGGDIVLSWIKQYSSLGETSRVLDIGCGYGRLAHALLRSGTFSGTYNGMDILAPHIAWCNEHLGNLEAYDGTYKFHYMDIKNGRYNPKGKLGVEDIQLNFTSQDLVVLTSVFTHMYIEDIEHYLQKIRPVLKPGGELFSTVFMLNATQKHNEDLNRSRYPMQHRHTEHTRYFSESDPLHAIGHEETFLKGVFLKSGFEIHKIIYGTWCGRRGADTYQDVIVAKTLS
jgi:SAM-dependent methyltransferase